MRFFYTANKGGKIANILNLESFSINQTQFSCLKMLFFSFFLAGGVTVFLFLFKICDIIESKEISTLFRQKIYKYEGRIST